MENVIIKNENLEVEISPLGAEVQKVTYMGKETLWDGNPNVWKGHSPILFPICGALKNDYYTYKDKKYDKMLKHGFAKVSMFSVDNVEKTSAVFSITSNEETKKMYPFDFEFRVLYTITNDTLKVYYFVTNLGKETMYYNVGSHEAFMLDGNIEDYSIEFENYNDKIFATCLEENLLSSKKYQLDLENGVLPLSYSIIDGKSMLPCGIISTESIIIDNIECERVYLYKNGEPILSMYFKDFSNLLLWTKENAKFIAIEPWNGITDLLSSNNKIEEKYKIENLKGGESKTFYHSVKFY